MKKNLTRLIFASASILAFSSFTCFAGEWKQAGDKWQYEFSNNSLASTVFVKEGDSYYYIGEDGYMLTDTFIDIGGDYYYFDESGLMLSNAWKEITDADGNINWYYFAANGKALRSKGVKVFPKQVGDKKYIFDQDGKMLTGFISEEGKVINRFDNPYQFLEAKYYLDKDGAMYENAWLLVDTSITPDLKSVVAMKDYSNYDEVWLYFGEGGKMIKARNDQKAKIITINDKKYAFDENGVMIPNFLISTAATEYKPPKMSLAHYDKDGSLITNRWTWTYPTVDMKEEEFNHLEYSWFRTDDNGKLLTNGIYDVNNRKYAFDKLGRMSVGFVLMRNGKFVKKYDVDEFNREDFLNQEETIIPGIDTCDLYIFNSDEFNDGSMHFDGDYIINLNSGDETFGTSKSGKVYGNRGRLQKVNGRYYFNGLKLVPNSDLGYGIIDIKKGNEKDYVLVNANGSLIKSKRKVFKDKEGNWIIVNNSKFFARLDDADAPRFRNGNWYRYDSSKKGNERYTEIIRPENFENNIDKDFLIFDYK